MSKQFYVFILLLFSFSCSQKVKEKPDKEIGFNHQKTYAMIIGTLEWTDKNLVSFEKKNRKDEELYNVLKATGIDNENILFLKDEEATLKNIQEKTTFILSETEQGSHFIFYYAGHGMHEKGKYYFANYDIVTSDPEKTGLDIEIIGDLISKNFKGERVSLWADCCYSGGLANIAENLSKKGFKTCALTSATATNTSTGNWTYSQTIIDCLKGDPLFDENNDGKITQNEMADEVKNAMKYRERQLNAYSYYNLDADHTIISPVSVKMDKTTDEIGSYVFGLYSGKWEVARIEEKVKDEYNCEFYFYSDKENRSLPKDKIRKPYFVQHTIGAEVKVEWEGKWYDATIIKSDGDFYYISYKDYDKSYDEWVTYDRIRTGKEKKIQAYWKNNYYPAEILDSMEGKYYIHYIGDDYTWDEWTDIKNIK